MCVLSGSCRRELISLPFQLPTFSHITPTSASVILSPSHTLSVLLPSSYDYIGPTWIVQVISSSRVLNLIASAKSLLGIRTWTSLGSQYSVYHHVRHWTITSPSLNLFFLQYLFSMNGTVINWVVQLRNLLGSSLILFFTLLFHRFNHQALLILYPKYPLNQTSFFHLYCFLQKSDHPSWLFNRSPHKLPLISVLYS